MVGLSATTETRGPDSFTDRFEQLVARGERDQARILGREVVKNARDVAITEADDHVVVETQHFRGRHDFVDHEDHRFVAEQGTYRYKSERFDFHFRVFTLNEAAKRELYPDEIMRGGGSSRHEPTNLEETSVLDRSLTSVRSLARAVRDRISWS